MGRWISKDGLLFGHFKGHFGVRSDGSHVMFGKWIGVDGRFRGLLRGTWAVDVGSDSSLLNSGTFQGDISRPDSSTIGTFEGNWIATISVSGRNHEGNGHGDDEDSLSVGEENGRGHGFMRGQWAVPCQ